MHGYKPGNRLNPMQMIKLHLILPVRPRGPRAATPSPRPGLLQGMDAAAEVPRAAQCCGSCLQNGRISQSACLHTVFVGLLL